MNATTTYTSEGIVVHPDCLRALLMFLGQDPTRPNLSRVFVDEEGHLTATDGHTLMRLMSIDPGGQVPRDRSGSQWSREAVEAAVKTAAPVKGKKRAEQHAQLRVLLRWDAVVPEGSAKAPPTANLIGIARDCAKKADEPDDGRGVLVHCGRRSDGWSMQARYMARLAAACELLTGDECYHRGPVLANNPRPLDPLLFELPWYEPHASDPKITYLDPAMRRAETKVVPEPDHAAEVIIMPLRV
jgi:hypothetical protein